MSRTMTSSLAPQITNEIEQHKIKIYEFPECEDEEEQKIMKRMKVMMVLFLFLLLLLFLVLLLLLFYFFNSIYLYYKLCVRSSGCER